MPDLRSDVAIFPVSGGLGLLRLVVVAKAQPRAVRVAASREADLGLELYFDRHVPSLSLQIFLRERFYSGLRGLNPKLAICVLKGRVWLMLWLSMAPVLEDRALGMTDYTVGSVRAVGKSRGQGTYRECYFRLADQVP